MRAVDYSLRALVLITAVGLLVLPDPLAWKLVCFTFFFVRSVGRSVSRWPDCVGKNGTESQWTRSIAPFGGFLGSLGQLSSCSRSYWE
jgi:hypothetical protein